MVKAIRVLAASAVVALAVGAGTAAANNGKGLGKPPTSDSTLVISPNPVNAGSAVALTFTFTMVGSSPASITNGSVEAEAPAGWTITGATIDVLSTCTVTNAVVTFTASEVEVEGLSCTSGTLVLDVTAMTPDVSTDTQYSFESSIKSSPGGRHFFNNVFLVPSATVTVQPVVV